MIRTKIVCCLVIYCGFHALQEFEPRGLSVTSIRTGLVDKVGLDNCQKRYDFRGCSH